MVNRGNVIEQARPPSIRAYREQLLSEIPVTERRLVLAGTSTAVLEGGDGLPIVLLHGPGEFGAWWMRVIPGLVRTHRVVAPDLPGHGASGLPDGPLDASRVLAWLGELIEATCMSSPVLVGYQLGGAIAARYAADRGDRLSRLVLVDTLGLARFFPAARFALAMVGFLARPTERSQERLLRRCFVDLDGMREQLDERWDPLEAYALERAQSPETKSALRSLMPKFGLPAIAPADLSRIRVSTSLIWGRYDPVVRLPIAESASERYGWPLHVIENAADDPPLEQPEAFLKALYASLGDSRRTDILPPKEKSDSDAHTFPVKRSST